VAGGFRVDLAALSSFGTALRADVERDLVPQRETIARNFAAVPAFGRRSASPDVRAAVARYYEQLNRTLELMDTLARNASVMAQVAADVAGRYARSDSVSGAQFQRLVDDATASVSRATASAEQARLAAEAAATRDEREWLADHGGRR
jgi:cell division septum initiation protein DivIVA